MILYTSTYCMRQNRRTTPPPSATTPTFNGKKAMAARALRQGRLTKREIAEAFDLPLPVVNGLKGMLLARGVEVPPEPTPAPHPSLTGERRWVGGEDDSPEEE